MLVMAARVSNLPMHRPLETCLAPFQAHLHGVLPAASHQAGQLRGAWTPTLPLADPFTFQGRFRAQRSNVMSPTTWRQDPGLHIYREESHPGLTERPAEDRSLP